MNYIIDEFVTNPTNNRYGVGFDRELKKQMDKRFPNKGTDNKYRRMANYLAPNYKGMHLEEENKLEAAKEYIKLEIERMEQYNYNPMESDQNDEVTDDIEPPMSPNTKLRMKNASKNTKFKNPKSWRKYVFNFKGIPKI